jgi:non-specific serine/threonine protein kinase
LRLHHPLRNSNGIFAALEHLAYLAATNGDLDRAARLLGAAATIAKPAGVDPERQRRYWRELENLSVDIRSPLGESAFDTAFQQGQRMSLDDAVNYALRADLARVPAPRPAPAPPANPLTMRERQVAELVSEGLTNQQIRADCGA